MRAIVQAGMSAAEMASQLPSCCQPEASHVLSLSKCSMMSAAVAAEAHLHSQPSRRHRSRGWWAHPQTAGGVGGKLRLRPQPSTPSRMQPKRRGRPHEEGTPAHLLTDQAATSHMAMHAQQAQEPAPAAAWAPSPAGQPATPAPACTLLQQTSQHPHLRQDGGPDLVSQRRHGGGGGAQEADACGCLIQGLGQLRLLRRVAPV